MDDVVRLTVLLFACQYGALWRHRHGRELRVGRVIALGHRRPRGLTKVLY